MKPRNKKQQHIVELNGRLRPLTTPQMNWALNTTIHHYGYRLKSGMCTCMKCGHEWLETRTGTHLCPECGTIIEIKDTKERVIRDKSYFNVITTMEDYQVVRMFLMIVEMRKGMKAKPAYLEIGSYWIDPKGNTTVVGLQRTLGHYIDSFAFGSPLEIRRDNEAFRRISDEYVYPRIKVTETIKRNGFKGSCHHIHPVTMFQELLTNPKAETLMKANEIELLRYLCSMPLHKADIETYWNTIKIANRNGYKVKESVLWIDSTRCTEVGITANIGGIEFYGTTELPADAECVPGNIKFEISGTSVYSFSDYQPEKLTACDFLHDLNGLVNAAGTPRCSFRLAATVTAAPHSSVSSTTDS